MVWIKWPWSRKRPAQAVATGAERAMRRDAAQPASSATDAADPHGEHGIVLYGTPWCGDCRRAQRVFAEMGIAYAYVDIEHDPDASALVVRLNDGMRSVPTIIFPDGSVLVEPGNAALTEKLAAYAA